MTRIYIVRHAEAEGNLYRRIHGQYDSLVTPLGYRQIEALSRRFQDIPMGVSATLGGGLPSLGVKVSPLQDMPPS